MEHDHLITVVLSGHEKKGSHFFYSIIGKDKIGQFNTVRRYSEFECLRKALFSKWPGLYIPSLPQKKLIGASDHTFIQMRKLGLSYFLQVLKQLDQFWYLQETQLFLRKIGDVERQLQRMGETNNSEILQRYKGRFGEFLNRQITKDINNEISDFGNFLNKLKNQLFNLEKMSLQVQSARKKYFEKYFNLLRTIIPDYEENCMLAYMNGLHQEDLIFTSQKDKLVPFFQEFAKVSNSTFFLLQQIKREKEQILAFEDVLKLKSYFSHQKEKATSKAKDLEIETSKIHSGQQPLMSKIIKKSKEQQIKQSQIITEKAQAEEKTLTQLCQIITILLADSEIKKFKDFRQKSYYNLLKKIFETEKEQCKLKKSFWSFVLKGNNQKEELDNFFEEEKPQTKNEGQTLSQESYESQTPNTNTNSQSQSAKKDFVENKQKKFENQEIDIEPKQTSKISQVEQNDQKAEINQKAETSQAEQVSSNQNDQKAEINQKAETSQAEQVSSNQNDQKAELNQKAETSQAEQVSSNQNDQKIVKIGSNQIQQ